MQKTPNRAIFSLKRNDVLIFSKKLEQNEWCIRMLTTLTILVSTKCLLFAKVCKSGKLQSEFSDPSEIKNALAVLEVAKACHGLLK